MSISGWPRTTWAAILILSGHAILASLLVQNKFIVVDEIAHVPSGLAHWMIGSMAPDRVNPPLARMIAVLPLLAVDAELDLSRWNDQPQERLEWIIGPDFAQAHRSRIFDLVRMARWAGIGWSLVGGWLIFLIGRQWFGARAGLLALTLWCFEPSVLAFSAVVTPDVPTMTMALAAAWAFRLWRFQPSWRRTAVAGVALGLALLTKFTLVLLVPIWLAIWAIDRWILQEEDHGLSLGRAPAGRLAMIAAIAVVVLNLGYGGQGAGRRLGELPFISRTFATTLSEKDDLKAPSPWSGVGNRFQGSWLGELPLLLPEDYVRGIDVQRLDFEKGFLSYAAGVWAIRGWWWFYLYAMAVKLPVGTLVLGFVGLLSLMIPRRFAANRGLASCSRFDRLWLFAHFFGFFIAISSQTGFSHHLRYAMPAFPFLFLAASSLASFRSRAIQGAAFALAGWAIVSSLTAFPNSLGYFNEWAGGIERGPKHLLFGNLDWGQDLTDLKSWLDSHPLEPLDGMACFHEFAMPALGLEGVLPPPRHPTGLFPRDLAYNADFGPKPGLYALSVQRLYDPKNEYAYFRMLKPMVRLGASIRLYRITRAQAESLRTELGLPPPSAIAP